MGTSGRYVDYGEKVHSGETSTRESWEALLVRLLVIG